jgi:uncharacterized protein YjbI with pentapeptide repeats
VANPKHVAELVKGIKYWNWWRKKNNRIVPDLARANLSQLDLRRADLSHADLSFAILHHVDLSEATLTDANLLGANLRRANLSLANLDRANLRFAELYGADLSKASLNTVNLSEANCAKASLCKANLRKANLSASRFRFANLTSAKLSRADLSRADMKSVNLQGADLSASQVLGTDFTEADFTGVCIQNWNLDSTASLNETYCSYVYLEKIGSTFSNRVPQDKIFQPGEFARHIQERSEMVSLYFANGITELLQMLQRLSREQIRDEVISVDSIEPKGERGISVDLTVVSNDDPARVAQLNTEQIQLIEATHRLQTQSEIIQLQQQHTSQIMELAKLGLSQSTSFIIEANAMSDSSSSQNNLQGANIGNYANQVSGNARQQTNQYNYDSRSQQNLADAAKEIQALLDQISKTSSGSTTSDKLAVANQALQCIQGDFSMSQRVMSAISAGSISALEQLLNHPAASFFISMLEDWKKTSVE